MILSREAYQRLRVDEERRALARLSAVESFGIAMALWTSSFAAAVAIAPEPRGENFARRLRVPAERLDVAWAAFRG